MRKGALLLSAGILAAVSSATVSSAAWAANRSEAETKACHPDVRKFCSDVKEGSNDNVYLSCLQDHRAKLSAKCKAVLESNGV